MVQDARHRRQRRVFPLSAGCEQGKPTGWLAGGGGGRWRGVCVAGSTVNALIQQLESQVGGWMDGGTRAERWPCRARYISGYSQSVISGGCCRWMRWW